MVANVHVEVQRPDALGPPLLCGKVRRKENVAADVGDAEFQLGQTAAFLNGILAETTAKFIVVFCEFVHLIKEFLLEVLLGEPLSFEHLHSISERANQ